MDEEVEGEQDVKQDDIGDRTGNELNTMIPVVCIFLTSRQSSWIDDISFRFMVKKVKQFRWCQSQGMFNHNCKFMLILIGLSILTLSQPPYRMKPSVSALCLSFCTFSIFLDILRALFHFMAYCGPIVQALDSTFLSHSICISWFLVTGRQ